MMQIDLKLHWDESYKQTNDTENKVQDVKFAHLKLEIR